MMLNVSLTDKFREKAQKCILDLANLANLANNPKERSTSILNWLSKLIAHTQMH
jgi:hypothetical protein